MLAKNEIKYYAKMAADSFADDPLYTALVRNKFIRKRFIYNFMYLRFHLSNGKDIFIEDKDKRGLCIWKSAKSEFGIKEAFSCPKIFNLLFYLPIVIKLEKAFSNADMSVFPENTLLLSPVFVDKKFQGKGIAKSLIENKANELIESGYTLGLETQNKMNVEIYSKLGFRLVKTEQYMNGKITNYLMIYSQKQNLINAINFL